MNITATPGNGFPPPTIPSIMFIFGVVGNIVAIVVLRISRKEQKETTFYTLVCGLAVTDLLGTLLVSPVTITTYVKGSWPGGEALCQYGGFILLFFFVVQLSIVFAMSVERYLAINHPYLYNEYINQKVAALALVVIYISNVVFCALPSVGFGQVTRQMSGTWCFINWHNNNATVKTFNLMYAGTNSVIVLSTVICNVMVCGALILMHRRFVRRTSLGTDQRHIAEFRRRRSFRRLAGAEVQMVILLIATSAVVLICSIPLLVSSGGGGHGIVLVSMEELPVKPKQRSVYSILIPKKGVADCCHRRTHFSDTQVGSFTRLFALDPAVYEIELLHGGAICGLRAIGAHILFSKV